MILINVELIIQMASIVCMVLGLFAGKVGFVVFGGFILLYSTLKDMMVYEDDDMGGGEIE